MASAGKAKNRVNRLLSQILVPWPAAVPVEDEGDEWRRFYENGRRRALQLGNRGPLRFEADGSLAEDILNAYYTHGFYVFEGVLSREEVEDWQQEFDTLLENAPAFKGSQVDKNGRPVKSPESYNLSVPRNQSWLPGQLKEGTSEDSSFWGPAAGSEENTTVVGAVYHPLMMMDAALRLYGHPQLLQAAESINGADFTPFVEVIFNKSANEGPGTAWHQDGLTHFDKNTGLPAGRGCHGFSFHGCFSNSTPENAMWVLPGTHLQRMEALGPNPDLKQLAEAVPMLMRPGDVGLHDRNVFHGSFPNRSPERRTTMQSGFHKRSFVLGAVAESVHQSRSMDVLSKVRYDEAWVHERSRTIQIAINARRQRYPHETPYIYKPLLGEEEQNQWSTKTREGYMKTYWKNNMYL